MKNNLKKASRPLELQVLKQKKASRPLELQVLKQKKENRITLQLNSNSNQNSNQTWIDVLFENYDNAIFIIVLYVRKKRIGEEE